ncbi:MAG: protein translocase subunit SecF [Syntrophaceae bacterium]
MKLAIYISLAAVILSVAYLGIHGLNFGIDFAGGTIVQIKFKQQTSIDKIRESLHLINMENSTIQQVGPGSDNEYLLKTEMSSSDLKGIGDKVEDSLSSIYGKGSFDVRRVEMVGPKAGADLRQKGIMAVSIAWIGMLIYITWRYELRFAVGGILALIHDVIITTALLTVLNKEFTLTIIAALLTIIGYSINDTIVVFDRIRENARKNIRLDLRAVINASINQTLSRTILTSFTVFLVLIALFFFGGTVIHDFAFVLLVGVIVGTYSSIFIASPLVLIWEKFKPGKRIRKAA